MARALTSAEYELLIENSPVMIWRSGLDASCDYFPTTWLLFTGRSLEQELGNGWAEPKPIDLRATCQQVIDEIAATARGRRITLECDTDSRGTWDEHRVLQVISNLASNAVQHGAPGSAVRVRLTGDDQRVTVEVSNDGSIPGELLPRIFEPFSSRRLHAKRSEGLGLGLFIAKAIARAHGGELEVDSADGVTRFRLVLPRRTCGC